MELLAVLQWAMVSLPQVFADFLWNMVPPLPIHYLQHMLGLFYSSFRFQGQSHFSPKTISVHAPYMTLFTLSCLAWFVIHLCQTDHKSLRGQKPSMSDFLSVSLVLGACEPKGKGENRFPSGFCIQLTQSVNWRCFALHWWLKFPFTTVGAWDPGFLKLHALLRMITHITQGAELALQQAGPSVNYELWNNWFLFNALSGHKYL